MPELAHVPACVPRAAHGSEWTWASRHHPNRVVVGLVVKMVVGTRDIFVVGKDDACELVCSDTMNKCTKNCLNLPYLIVDMISYMNKAGTTVPTNNGIGYDRYQGVVVSYMSTSLWLLPSIHMDSKTTLTRIL